MIKYGPLLLFLLGAVVVVVGLTQDRHSDFVYWGGALATLGAFGPRLQWFKASATGVEAKMTTLTAEDVEPTVAEYAKRALPPAEAARVVSAARELMHGREILIRPEPEHADSTEVAEIKEQVVDLLAEGLVRAVESEAAD